MSLSKNLQTLRKMRGLSQEEFADQLDVSRQAVSKWESGEAYPETEKIITICRLFDCSMDELVRGEIRAERKSRRNPVAAENYDRIMNRAARGTALGLGLILLGLALMLTVQGLWPDPEQGGVIGAVVMIGAIILALPCILVEKMWVREFRKYNPVLKDVYPDAVATAEKMKYIKLFSVGVGIILVGVVTVLILLATNSLASNLVVAVLMYFITVGETLAFYAGKMSAKYDLEKYNLQNTPEMHQRMALARKIEGVIMIGAAMIFVIWGSVTGSWEMNWLVFLVAVLLCVMVNVVLGRERRLR